MEHNGNDQTAAPRVLFDWRAGIAKSDLPPTARHVALTLSMHMSILGDSCWPSVTTLAEETGLCETAIRKQLRILEDEGWLTTQRGGGRSSNRYTATRTAPPSPHAGQPSNVVPVSPSPDTEELFIEHVIESEQPSPTGAAVATRAVGAQNLVGHYVDAVRAQGAPATKQTIGIVARQTKALLDEGVSADVVADAIDILVARRLHPSVLPTLILEAAAGPPEPRPSGAMRYGRGMTTAQILEATKDLT